MSCGRPQGLNGRPRGSPLHGSEAGAEGSAPRQGMFAFTGFKVGVGNINLKRKVFIYQEKAFNLRCENIYTYINIETL